MWNSASNSAIQRHTSVSKHCRLQNRTRIVSWYLMLGLLWVFGTEMWWNPPYLKSKLTETIFPHIINTHKIFRWTNKIKYKSWHQRAPLHERLRTVTTNISTVLVWCTDSVAQYRQVFAESVRRVDKKRRANEQVMVTTRRVRYIADKLLCLFHRMP